MKEDFNRVKGSSVTYVPGPGNSDCQKIRISTTCDPDKCGEAILCYQANVSRCEAELFCSAVEKLICELNKAKTLCELRQVFDMINSLLTSSAAKELSLAGIIKSSSVSKLKANRDCSCDH